MRARFARRSQSHAPAWMQRVFSDSGLKASWLNMLMPDRISTLQSTVRRTKKSNKHVRRSAEAFPQHGVVRQRHAPTAQGHSLAQRSCSWPEVSIEPKCGRIGRDQSRPRQPHIVICEGHYASIGFLVLLTALVGFACVFCCH